MLPLVQVTMELVMPPLVVPPLLKSALVIPPPEMVLLSLTSLLLQGCRRRKNQTVMMVGPMLLGPPLRQLESSPSSTPWQVESPLVLIYLYPSYSFLSSPWRVEDGQRVQI